MQLTNTSIPLRQNQHKRSLHNSSLKLLLNPAEASQSQQKHTRSAPGSLPAKTEKMLQNQRTAAAAQLPPHTKLKQHHNLRPEKPQQKGTGPAATPAAAQHQKEPRTQDPAATPTTRTGCHTYQNYTVTEILSRQRIGFQLHS